MKNKAKFWCWTVVGFALICGLVIGAACWVSYAQKKQAQEHFVTRLEEVLKDFPALDKMHAYGEFYLKTEDAEYLVVKTGDSLLLGERTETETKYFESAADAKAVLDALAAEIKARQAKDGAYTCEKVGGPWKLRVMPDSKWLVTCKREGYSQEEYITHIEDGEKEQLGWVMYNGYDDVKMYVFLDSVIDPEHDDGHIFGWGELPEADVIDAFRKATLCE